MKPTELKLKTCRVCGDKFAPPNTIRKVCFKYECQVAAAEKHQAKVEATRAKRERQELREAKERIKTRSQWLKDVQVVYNRYRLLVNKGMRCISCGQGSGAKMNAGHYRSVGACPELRYEDDNVWPQCEHCNSYLSSNTIEYRKRLILKIGVERVEWLEGKHEPKKYTIEQLKEMKKYYQKECNRLRKENEAS